MTHHLCQLSRGDMSDHFPANATLRYIISLLDFLSHSASPGLPTQHVGSLTSASQKLAEKIISAHTRFLGEQA